MVIIYLPNNINFLILRNKHLYLYNNSYFFCVYLYNFRITYNKYLNILKFTNISNNVRQPNFVSKLLNNFIFSWDYFFFNKLYFLGKGFKIKKIEKNLIFNFNHSHLNILLNFNVIVKKIQKTKLLIFSKNLKNLKSITNSIINIKRVNPYTKRGLRVSKQIIFKKRNKSNIQN